MEPLLPGEHRLGPLLERAHDLIRQSERLAGWSPEGALPGLRRLLATAQVSALLRRGLLETDSPHGTRRLGVPQHALRFCFPHLWPEAEAQA